MTRKGKKRSRISKRKRQKERRTATELPKNLNGLYTKNEPFLLKHLSLPRHFFVVRFHSFFQSMTLETGVDLVLFSLALSTSPLYMLIPFVSWQKLKSTKGSNVACRYYLVSWMSLVFDFCLCAFFEFGTPFYFLFFCLLLGFSRTLDRKRHSFNGREAVLYLFVGFVVSILMMRILM